MSFLNDLLLLLLSIIMLMFVMVEYRRDQQMMHKSINMDQSNAQLLEDLKRVRESLFYSEDKVESLKERLQERDKVIKNAK